jgi:thiaminase
MMIVALGFKRGDRTFERLDYVCLVGGLLGLGVLVVTRNPTLAVFTSIVTDGIGTMPTFKHCWVKPQEETLSTYGLYALGAGLLLAVADFHVFAAYAYPLYIAVVDSVIVLLLVGRADVTAKARVTAVSNPARTSVVRATVSHTQAGWSVLGQLAATELQMDSAVMFEWAGQYKVLLAADVRAALALHESGCNPQLDQLLYDVATESDHGKVQLDLATKAHGVSAPKPVLPAVRDYSKFIGECVHRGLAEGLMVIYARQLAQHTIARQLERDLTPGTWTHDWFADRASGSFARRVSELSDCLDAVPELPATIDPRRAVQIATHVIDFELALLNALAPHRIAAA